MLEVVPYARTGRRRHFLLCSSISNNRKVTTKDRLQALRTILQADIARFELLSQRRSSHVSQEPERTYRRYQTSSKQSQTADSSNNNQGGQSYSLKSKELDKMIKDTHKTLIDAEASNKTIENNNKTS